MPGYVDIESVRDDFMNAVYAECSDDKDNNRANRIIDAFDDLPAADVAPVVHGAWVQTDIFKCSECGYSFEPEGYMAYFNYCPNCGVKMDGKGGEENG